MHLHCSKDLSPESSAIRQVRERGRSMYLRGDQLSLNHQHSCFKSQAFPVPSKSFTRFSTFTNRAMTQNFPKCTRNARLTDSIFQVRKHTIEERTCKGPKARSPDQLPGVAKRQHTTRGRCSHLDPGLDGALIGLASHHSTVVIISSFDPAATHHLAPLLGHSRYP